MNKLVIKALLLSLAFAGSSVAQAEWSMNAGATTDYLFRGISQTGGRPAISGGFDYEQENGFFFGGWVSSIDFGTDGPDPSLEADLYLGYGGGDFFGYSITYAQYLYPYINLRGSNYGELLLDFNVSDFVFGLAYTTDAEENKGGDGLGTFNQVGDTFLYLGYAGDYDAGWSFGTSMGFMQFATDDTERKEKGNPAFYYYYDLGVAKSTDAGEIKLSLSKVINYIGPMGEDTSATRSWRPVLTWTTFF